MISLPVCGFRPLRALVLRVRNAPNPTRPNSRPASSSMAMIPSFALVEKIASMISAAWVLDRSHFLASFSENSSLVMGDLQEGLYSEELDSGTPLRMAGNAGDGNLEQPGTGDGRRGM